MLVNFYVVNYLVKSPLLENSFDLRKHLFDGVIGRRVGRVEDGSDVKLLVRLHSCWALVNLQVVDEEVKSSSSKFLPEFLQKAYVLELVDSLFGDFEVFKLAIGGNSC